MVDKIVNRLISDFPEYLYLADLLRLAEVTWSRYGLSADKLAECDPLVLEMVRITVKNR